jgi:predicted 3-demethylubiquinone-9 3-methyltransferase (glyoxalase superfamily)
MKNAKNTICPWFDKDAQDAARFSAATFPNREVTAVHKAPADKLHYDEIKLIT